MPATKLTDRPAPSAKPSRSLVTRTAADLIARAVESSQPSSKAPNGVKVAFAEAPKRVAEKSCAFDVAPDAVLTRQRSADDSELVALGREHEAAYERWRLAFPAFAAADEDFKANVEVDFSTPPGMSETEKWGRYTQARADHGVGALDEANDAALQAIQAVNEGIRSTEATSLAGLAVKARLLVSECLTRKGPEPAAYRLERSDYDSLDWDHLIIRELVDEIDRLAEESSARSDDTSKKGGADPLSARLIALEDALQRSSDADDERGDEIYKKEVSPIYRELAERAPEPTTNAGAAKALRFIKHGFEIGESSADEAVLDAVIRFLERGEPASGLSGLEAFLSRPLPEVIEQIAASRGEPVGELVAIIEAYEAASTAFNAGPTEGPEGERLEAEMFDTFAKVTDTFQTRGVDTGTLEEAKAACRLAMREYDKGDPNLAATLALSSLAYFLGEEAVS